MQSHETHPECWARELNASGFYDGGATREDDDLMEADVKFAKSNLNVGGKGSSKMGMAEYFNRDMATSEDNKLLTAAAKEASGARTRSRQGTLTRVLERQALAGLRAAWDKYVLLDPFDQAGGKVITLVRAAVVHPDVVLAMRGTFARGRARLDVWMQRINKEGGGDEAKLSVTSRIRRTNRQAFSATLPTRSHGRVTAREELALAALNAFWLVASANSKLDVPLPMSATLCFPIGYTAGCLTAHDGHPNPQPNRNALFSALRKVAGSDEGAAGALLPAVRATNAPVVVIVDGGKDTFDVETGLTLAKDVQAYYDSLVRGAIVLANALNLCDGDTVTDVLYLVLDPCPPPELDTKFGETHASHRVPQGTEPPTYLVLARSEKLSKTQRSHILRSRANRAVLQHGIHGYLASGTCLAAVAWLQGKAGRKFVLVTASAPSADGGTFAVACTSSAGVVVTADVPGLTTATVGTGLVTSELLAQRCQTLAARQLRAAANLGQVPVGVVCHARMHGDTAAACVSDCAEMQGVVFGVVVLPKLDGVEQPTTINLHTLAAALPDGVASAVRAAHVATGTLFSQTITAGRKTQNTTAVVTKAQVLAALKELPVRALQQLADYGAAAFGATDVGGAGFLELLAGLQTLVCRLFLNRMADVSLLARPGTDLDGEQVAELTPSGMRCPLWLDGKQTLRDIIYTDDHSLAHALRVALHLRWFQHVAAAGELVAVETRPLDAGYVADQHGGIAPAHMLMVEAEATLVPAALRLDNAFVCSCGDESNTKATRPVCKAPKVRKDTTKPLSCPCLQAGRKCTDLCRCVKARCANMHAGSSNVRTARTAAWRRCAGG